MRYRGREGERIYPWFVTSEERRRYFGHCYFKGTSTTVTNNSTYEPSEYELQMQKIQADYADAIAPNSLWLNDTARELLEDSLGTVQVDFNALNKQAQKQINDATSGLNSLTSANTSAANSANSGLGSIPGANTSAANSANANLGSLIGSNSNAASSTNANLGNLATSNTRAANAANSTLSGLENGNLPTGYQTAMEKSIATALANTLGSSINSLANRGVLNSSVTNQALNDISANAADTVAQQYQTNINTVADLANQQNTNLLNANNANSQYYQNQVGNTLNANAANAGIYNSQLSNTLNANSANADVYNAQASNALNANAANAAIYGNLLDNASAGTIAAAAAQEAAQTPALNLWNASIGLNGANTGALAAAAGQGKTSSTSTSSGSGGGLFSSLLG